MYGYLNTRRLGDVNPSFSEGVIIASLAAVARLYR